MTIILAFSQERFLPGVYTIAKYRDSRPTLFRRKAMIGGTDGRK